MRAEAATFAEEDRVDEAGHSGADLDRSAAGIVEHTCRSRCKSLISKSASGHRNGLTILERPSFGRPNPVHHGAVHASRPAEEENARRQYATSFSSSADQDCVGRTNVSS